MWHSAGLWAVIEKYNTMFGLAISQLRKASKLCPVSKYQLWQIDFFPGSAYGSEEAATGIDRNQWDFSQEDSDLLTQCMWQAVQNGAAAVVAVGGDGTLNEVIALWIWKYRPYICMLSSLLTLFDHIQTILNHFEGSYKNPKKSSILLCEAKVFEMLECTGMASSTAWNIQRLYSCMTWTFSSST